MASPTPNGHAECQLPGCRTRNGAGKSTRIAPSCSSGRSLISRYSARSRIASSRKRDRSEQFQADIHASACLAWFLETYTTLYSFFRSPKGGRVLWRHPFVSRTAWSKSGLHGRNASSSINGASTGVPWAAVGTKQPSISSSRLKSWTQSEKRSCLWIFGILGAAWSSAGLLPCLEGPYLLARACWNRWCLGSEAKDQPCARQCRRRGGAWDPRWCKQRDRSMVSDEIWPPCASFVSNGSPHCRICCSLPPCSSFGVTLLHSWCLSVLIEVRRVPLCGIVC